MTILRSTSVVLLGFLFFYGAIPHGRAATTIYIQTNVVVQGVTPFGIGLAQINYYDSGQMMKELLFRNPGFEGLLYQSAVRIGSGSTTSAVEDLPLTQWPSGFWDGASYEYAWGAAYPRTGMVTRSIAPLRVNPPTDPAGNTNGTTYIFADTGMAPAAGDYLIVRRVHRGGTGYGAAFGSWSAETQGVGTVTTELADLPAGTEGLQCVRLSAPGPGDRAGVSGQFDTIALRFVLLNGAFRLSFKARGLGTNDQLAATVQRASQSPYLSATVQVGNAWSTYELPFSAAESNTVSGAVTVRFTALGRSTILLDDASLRQTNSSPANPTEFRDAVVDALIDLKPGILRHPNWQNLGTTIANELAPVFGRMRSGYSVYSTQENNMMPGLHEFLVLSEHIGADPWYCLSPTVSTQEVAVLMEYLAGPTNTTYGALRALRGHPLPWTSAFRRIHLEFGNENWNNTAFRGGCFSVAVPCGERAAEIFSHIKGSPHYAAAAFNLILGGQSGGPTPALQLHNACSRHDMFTLAPYMASRVDAYTNNESLFGPLFAETQWWSQRPSPTSGLVRLQWGNLQASARPVPLSIYEVNLHTTEGSISQEALDQFTPSIGAAVAVGGHMLNMLREMAIRDQVFFSLAGHRMSRSDGKTVALWGIARDFGVTNLKRPHYHMLRMLNRALSGHLVQTVHTGDDPTWNQLYVNRVSFTNAHTLQSFAFADGDDRSLILLNYDRSTTLDVDFAGLACPTGIVVQELLTAASINDGNESNEVVARVRQTYGAFNPAVALSIPPFSMTLLRWSVRGPGLNLQGLPGASSAEVSWDGMAGLRYVVQYSTNLVDWTDAGPPQPGEDATLSFLDDGTYTGGLPPDQRHPRTYRVKVEPGT